MQTHACGPTHALRTGQHTRAQRARAVVKPLLSAHSLSLRIHPRCNQIDPTIKREAWSEEEDMIIVRERTQSAPTPWVAIAALLQGRPDNAIKNRWNSTLRRRHAPA